MAMSGTNPGSIDIYLLSSLAVQSDMVLVVSVDIDKDAAVNLFEVLE
jgi:hypothetical protein